MSSTAKVLLDRLVDAGSDLSLEGDELVVRGDRSLLTDALVAELREHKAELVALVQEKLVERRAGSAAGGPGQQEAGEPAVAIDLEEPGWPPTDPGSRVPPRPPGRATYGITARGRVVELSTRRPADEREDPLRWVAGEGWPAWYPP